MKNNVKKAKSAASVPMTATEESTSVNTGVDHGMESGTLPPATMLLHANDFNQVPPPLPSSQQIPPSDSPMNQFSDVYSARQSTQTNNNNNNNKTNKRKLDELAESAATEFEPSYSLKPPKSDQNEPERSLSRTGTPLSNGPPISSAPFRNGNDTGPAPYEFALPASTTPNPPLLTRQTPPSSSVQSLPLPPPSSYMPMSPRTQYNMTSDSPYLQTNNQVFVFTTQLANDAVESVLKNEHPNIIEFHKSLPSTAQYLSSLSNNNHNSLMGGPMHLNPPLPPPPGCHSPRTMQMMMPAPPHHHPHLSQNGGNGPPSNWSHPHFHQQQPPFGRLTPGPGGLPPPNHLLPPGALMMNGSPPPPGMRMGGMPPMPPGMGQPLPDGIENLTPERAKHRKNQLDKLQEIKSKITGGRGRGGRGKANAANTVNMPPSMNGGPLDPHQQMMMMNSPHGVAPPHHMMGVGPPPPHMLPPGMRGPPDGMMLDINGQPIPPHGYMNGPMPPGFHGQFGPGPGDPYGPLPPHHPQAQAMRDWNKMQMEHFEGKAQQMRGQPPPYSSSSPSSLTPPMGPSSGPGLGPNGKLLSPRMDPSTLPRLYKVGQPEKFIPDSLPSASKKLPGSVGEVQMTASPTQMDYNDFGMEGEELIITRHLNRAYRPGGPSSSSSCKDEPMTPSQQRSTSTPNNNLSVLSSGQQQQQLPGSTTPTHHPQGITPQSVPAASPRSTKLSINNNLASPSMMSNNNSAKDEPLDMNGDPKTPISNMAPPLSSMLQMTNSLQSSGSPYNSSKQSMNSPSLGHSSKSMDHLSLPPQHMQFQSMNPHHRMLGPPDSMPPHFNPHHPNNLPPPHPHMYKMMPPHPGMDPGGMMMPYPGGSLRSSKSLPPLPPSADPMQAHLHHLPPPHYVKMHNMDAMMVLPPGHQPAHMRFSPMMDDGFGMGPPPHHPHMHPHMHPAHHPMHLNDGRSGPPLPPQAINNTYVSATMSIQQLNIQHLGPNGPPGELQAGTLHYHASSGNGPDSQHSQFPPNDPQYCSQFNDLQVPPSNLSVDGGQPSNYW